MELCRATYQVCAGLPDTERFGISLQLRRAAVSVPSNIAEGFGRESRQDLIRFFRIARGSLYEVQTLFQLCVDLGFVQDATIPWELAAETDRVLQGLIRSLLAKQDSG